MAEAIVGSGSAPSGVRLAELVGALSLAVDLGLGQRSEHVARSCLLALGLGERLGIDDRQRGALYYIAMLGWVGCIADSRDAAAVFGDDIDYRAGVYDIDMKPLPFLGYLMRRAGTGRPAPQRLGAKAALAVSGAASVQESLRLNCQVTSAISARLGLGREVSEPLQQIFTRWDARGLPSGVGGEQIALPVRLWHVADVAEVYHGRAGIEAAVAVARQRRGTQFDPAIVDCFQTSAAELLGALPDGSSWNHVVEVEPQLRPALTQKQFDAALEVSPTTPISSRRTSPRTLPWRGRPGRGRRPPPRPRPGGRAAGTAGSPGPRPRADRSAEHHLGQARSADAGRVGTGAVALLLHRADAGAAAHAAGDRSLAALAHERLDGSGYHRGLPGAAIPVAGRLLAAADSYHAMLESRPHRDPLPDRDAARTLRDAVRAGWLDPHAVDAVLAVAGHRPARRPPGPAGLTAREVEVLILLARGRQTVRSPAAWA